ncbi:C2 calcium/lipid-binding plant phosphoribosyltransferase family protein [Striga hermonthica]|uniref:C2 calcium/lipid-binding plant phosphoribosyltransferase family protein n=1 Tax=Striga hermonthica TaxID=68872 RepID=A0A9N7REC8_STRHE|nr:C2 calcium/lipid-binding plant phosphoribosyltransferase family protein [Striga hermonthica]
MAAKLVVEVLEASNLVPKNIHENSSPFVEVKFDRQRKRTSTKPNNLINPTWNEQLVFDIENPNDLSTRSVEVFVYNDKNNGKHKNFFGKVRISGSSISRSEQESVFLKYPLEKRGLFSQVKGEITLKIHSSNENSNHEKRKKEGKVKTFHSVSAAPRKSVPVSSSSADTITTVMRMQAPSTQKPDYGLVETKPPLAARLGYWGRDKTASMYDMVEPMNFLYVRVVKASDLPSNDVSGSIDPYVEVKIGNYKGVTKHFEKNHNPFWDRVFAFSKERLQSSSVEVNVKDKDFSRDDFVGRVTFDLNDVPKRVAPDSPLAPQWYKLHDKNGVLLRHGDIMLAVWMGTQADEAFPYAWQSDAHGVTQQNLTNTRSKVYFTPKMYYLRVHVIEAQDLVPADKSKPPDPIVRVQHGKQSRITRPVKGSVNPEWNEELMYVAWEPLNEYIVVSVEDKGKVIGRVLIPVNSVKKRVESKLPDTQWYPLQRPALAEDQIEMKMDKFASRVHLRLSLDAGYHVLDELTQFSSDRQPSANQLRKRSVGILEVGILSARNLTAMKAKQGKLTDAYCVAKYGCKWVRTRTILDSCHPTWNEQYTWEVFDTCTVFTVGVFDNCHVSGGEGAKDQKMGKVRIRVSTLEADRVYTYTYPLLVLGPSGLKRNGEIHLAVRFTCTAWAHMLAQYGRPLLPKMHYVHPINVKHVDLLRHYAMNIVANELARAEPPLRAEVIEYMFDVDHQMFSLRRSKANFHRMMSVVSGVQHACTWFEGICQWKYPVTTVLVHILFLILVCYPELIFPTVFLYLSVIGLWNYRFRPRNPPHMDPNLSQAENANSDELEEEFDSFPTTKPSDFVRMRYDRLRSVAGRVQTVTADVANQGERALALLNWRDPRATAIFLVFSLIMAVFLYVVPFKIVALLVGIYLLRHPRLRYKLPPAPVNFFKRLPARSDSLL